MAKRKTKDRKTKDRGAASRVAEARVAIGKRDARSPLAFGKDPIARKTTRGRAGSD